MALVPTTNCANAASHCRRAAVFLSLSEQRPFDMERFKQAPGSLDDMDLRFQEAHADAPPTRRAWMKPNSARTIEFPVAAYKDFHLRCGMR